MKKSVFKPEGGLNSDINDRDLPEADYRMMRNLLSGFSNSNNKGTASTPNGLILVGDNYEPSGIVTLKVIGTAVDHANDAIIEFVASNLNFDTLRRVYNETNITEVIFQGNLDFTDVRITHANVVDGMLMWSQKGTYPKKINIDKAKRYIDSGGSDPEGYPFIDYQTIAAGAFPPNFKPESSYITVSDYFSNFVNKDIYQFAYYYVYDDNEISQLSPCSRISAPKSSWNYLGGKRGTDNYNNAISVSFNTGHHKVKKIGFCYRTSLSAPWRVFTEIDKDNLGNFQTSVVQFFGNESYKALDIQQRNYDYIPLEADAQEYVHTNNVVYASYTNGFDLPKSQVIINPILTNPQTLSAYAINIQDNVVLIETDDYPGTPGGKVSDGFAQKTKADLWFSEVPPVGTVINIVVKPTTDVVFNVNYAEFGDGIDYNHYSLDVYRKVEDTGEFILNDQTDYGIGDVAPKFELNYEVTQLDVDNGLTYFLGKVKDAANVAWDDYKVEYQAWTTLFQSQLESYYAPSLGSETVIVTVSDNFLDNPVTSGIYSDISADYTTPTNISAYSDPTNISTLEYVRFDGCYFLYDLYDKKPATTDYYANENGEGGSIYFRSGYYGGYFEFDLKKKFTPFISGDTVGTLKSGSFKTFGINYYDKLNRDSSVLSNNKISASNGFRVYIPFAFETIIPDGEIYKWVLNTFIYHQPPSGVTHYKWVVSNNSPILSFGWFCLKGVIADPSPDSDRIKLTVYRHPKSPSVGGEIKHVIAVGDIMRPSIKDSTISAYEFFNEPLELTVLAIDEVSDVDGNPIVYVENFDFATYGLIENSIVEFYTVKNLQEDSESNFIEVGEEYEILDPDTDQRRHAGKTTNQSSDYQTAAASILEITDVWIRQRRFSNNEVIYVEDPNFSDYFNSSMNDKGRIAIADPNAKRRKYSNYIIHGGKYFADTQVNDLFSISGTSAKPLALEHGAINALASVGYVLKAYQPYKCNSIYIGRTVASNTDDTTNELQLINNVIGTITPSEEIYGCSNPESVIKARRSIFFFDKHNSVWVRDSANGLFPISEYGYKTYWADKTKEIVAAGANNVSVLAGMDLRNNVLFCSVHADNLNYNYLQDTVMFKEGENRWVGHLDAFPESMAFIGDDLFFFKNSNCYRLYGGEPGVFFGQKLAASIEFIMKSEGWTEKVFNAITLMSNVIAYVELTIPKEYSSSKRDMKSRILAANLQRDESTFHGEIKSDMLTPGFTSEAIALLNGDSMRGKAIRVKIVFDKNDYVEFYGAIMMEETSNWTP